MGLEAGEAVDDVDAGFLQLLGPLDVVRLVEAGFQLHQRGDLLPVLRGLDESADERGIAAGAVKRLLDRKHLRIAGGLLDKIDDGLKRVVGMVEQDILRAQGVKDGCRVAQRGGVHRGEDRELQIGPVEISDALEAHQIDRALQAENMVRRQTEFVAERRKEHGVHAVLDLKAHGGTAAEVAQLLLDLHQEVCSFLLVDVEFAVAGDAKRVGRRQPITGEEFAGAELDNLAQKNRALRTAAARQNAHQPRQNPRHRQNGDEVFDLGRRGIVQRDDDVEFLVAELGKRMRLIEGERRQDGINLFPEIGTHPGEFARGEVAGGLEVDAFGREGRDQLLAPAAVLILDEGVDAGADLLELLARIEAVGAGFDDARVALLHETGDADLEKLVEVAAGDGQKAHPLDQRMAVALRLFEHAAVEREPAEFAIEVNRRRRAGRGVSGALGHAGREREAIPSGGRNEPFQPQSPECNTEAAARTA